MKNEKQLKEMSFTALYDKMQEEEKESLREHLRMKGMKASTFYGKKNDPRRFTLLEREEISRYLNKSVTELF